MWTLVDKAEDGIEPEWFTLQKRSERSNVRGLWIITFFKSWIDKASATGQLQVTAYIVRKSTGIAKSVSKINVAAAGSLEVPRARLFRLMCSYSS